MRHRPFGIAGDWHSLPRRVRARQRGVHIADDGLAPLVYVDVLDRHFLLALAAMSVEGFKQGCVCPGQLVRLGESFPPTLERLFAKHRAPITLHRGVVSGDELGGEHSLHLVIWRDADECLDCRAGLLANPFGIVTPRHIVFTA